MALAGTIASDAMADPIELAELFDVDIDQLASVPVLVTAHRFSRVQVAHPTQAQSPQHAVDGRGRETDPGGDMWPVRRCRCNVSIIAQVAGVV